MTIQQIINVIEQIAPTIYQEGYDNAGLILGNTDELVKGVLLSVDVTEEVIDEAISKGCNLIIAHHPLIFNGLKKITGRTYTEKVVLQAIRNNIAVYCAHTNIDTVWEGVNVHVGKKLKLTNIQILREASHKLYKIVTFVPTSHADKVRQALFDGGCGIIGNYDWCSYNLKGEGTFRGGENTNPFVGSRGQLHFEEEIRVETICPIHALPTAITSMLHAHPYEEPAYDIYCLENKYTKVGLGIIGELPEPIDTFIFLESLKNLFKVPCIKHTRVIHKKILRVAFCGGSGSELLSDAIKNKADVFISADFKYHQFFEANNQIIIVDIGHFESEQFVTEIFYNILTKNFSNFAVHFSVTNTNPVNYL